MSTYGWHFLGGALRDGSPIPEDGVWLPTIRRIKICERGYHGSIHPFDALQYAPGALLTYCEFDGEIQAHDDKLCAERRRIVCRMDATEMLRYFARMQAVSVVHLWDTPEVVLDYLMTGDESLRPAAWAAARPAASAAARHASWAAAWAASWAAAREASWAAAREVARQASWEAARQASWEAAKTDFAALVHECFESVVTPEGLRK